jgi:hypothetical protein
MPKSLADHPAQWAQFGQARTAEPSTMASGNGPAQAEMLEGKALLDRARALSNRPEEQIARACGYVGPSGRVLRKSFYRALVAAKGYALPSSAVAPHPGIKGRQAEFRTRVHGNGNLLIGSAYTKKMGLEPGQEFRIELHPETGSIWLLPLDDHQTEPAGE